MVSLLKAQLNNQFKKISNKIKKVLEVRMSDFYPHKWNEERKLWLTLCYMRYHRANRVQNAQASIGLVFTDIFSISLVSGRTLNWSRSLLRTLLGIQTEGQRQIQIMKLKLQVLHSLFFTLAW
jgi:hypothetical protein